MNEACWEGYKQVGMKKKGNRTVPNCVKKNKFSFAEWLNESDEQYQGDSNPMSNDWVDTWHEAQRHAFSGDIKLAVSMMKKAAQQARQESPGEAKYYLGTAAWLSGDKAKCLAMTKDSDVVQTGNDKVLLRLLNSKTSNYQQAYSQNENEEEVFPKKYVKAFASLPWDWEAMQRDKIVQPLFFYSPEQSDVMEDWQDSIITLFNLLVEKIPRNQLSAVNRHTGNKPDQGLFLKRLRNTSDVQGEATWYDKKIDQIYWSIKKVGKTPEDYGGRDIRSEITMESNHDSKSKYSGLFQQWDDMDQSMRNELSKSYTEKYGTEFKQELWDANLKQFIDKYQTTPDDVFGDSKRLTQLKEILPNLDYSKFSKRNWEQFWTLAQHADNDEYLQKQALSVLARYKQNQHYLNLLWRIANNNGVMDQLYQKAGIPKPTTMDLDQLPSIMQQIAQKLNMSVNQLHQHIAQTIK
jgi:hypothetical protein